MDVTMLRYVICLIGCAAATYYDLFNRRNVPAYVTYGLVALGILFTLASLDASVIMQNFAVAIAIFAVGYLLYRAGQIGGADVLVFVSIALLLPEGPQPLLTSVKSPFSYPFVLSVFLFSGVLGVFGIFLKYVPRTLYDAMKGEEVKLNTSHVLQSVLLLFIYSVFLYYINTLAPLPQLPAFIFMVVVVCATILFSLKDYISDRYLIEMVSVREIDEEDILAVDKMDPRVVKKYGLDKLLTVEQIGKLKKMGKGKKFPVYTNMPVFMPYVLISLVAALLFGDPLTYFYPFGAV
ncbi:MAG: A24 family peptidase [Candidatus Micrarchaeota archaeon]|nr:A24 family peptidase [Candidatus Micrarchaeota archaeon]